MADGSDLPVQILNGTPGLHQLSGCVQLLAAGARPEKGHWASPPPPASSMCPPPVRPSACRWMTPCAPCTTSPPRPSCLPWPAPTPAPAVPTACPALATGSRCPMSATLSTAKLIQHEVSDGIIAPGYDADALEVLKSKKKGQLRHRADRRCLRARNRWRPAPSLA